MYTISAAAAATGIPEATLRAWERRYDVVTPARSASGYRLYSDADLGDLLLMLHLLDSGWAVRQAAEEIRRRQLLGIPATRPQPGGGTGATSNNDLVTAALTMDGQRIQKLLDERFGTGAFEQVAGEWMLPSLGAIGDAWSAGELDVAAEHLVSQMLLQRASAAFAAVPDVESAPRIVVGLPASCHHELGLITFAVAARRAGLEVTYLGADVPVQSWLHAVARRRANAAVLAVPRVEDAPAAALTARALWTSQPELVVGVGGGHQNLVKGADMLGHDLVAAAAGLSERLRSAGAVSTFSG